MRSSLRAGAELDLQSDENKESVAQILKGGRISLR